MIELIDLNSRGTVGRRICGKIEAADLEHAGGTLREELEQTPIAL